MRVFGRVVLVLAVAVLAAGPTLSAAALVTHGPTIGISTGDGHSPLADVLTWLGGGVVAFGLTIKKDIGSIAQKFVTRAQAAAGDYKTGVQGAGSTWESAAGAAEPSYEAGVQAAISSKRFAKGVAGKGGKYQTNAVNLGSQRYGPGVANAQQAYQQGMAPVIAALQSVNPPPRSFRGSPANQARSNAVSTALAALRSNK
jgi:hypothetical protein